jgi:hypothetical protein
LEQIESIRRIIDELDVEIKNRIASRREDLKIAMSIPGIGFTSAVTILAEIGDFKDFDTAEHLAAWSGPFQLCINLLISLLLVASPNEVQGIYGGYWSRLLRL